MKTDLTISTKRLLLRPFALTDLGSAHAYAGDAENSKYMLFLPNETIADTEKFLRYAAKEWEKDLPRAYEFAIVLEGRHIGAVSVEIDEKGQEGEMGWVLHSGYQGKGYATEAAKALSDFAINELKVTKLVAHCDFRNTASKKVMENIGMALISDDGVRTYRDGETAKECEYGLEVSK